MGRESTVVSLSAIASAKADRQWGGAICASLLAVGIPLAVSAKSTAVYCDRVMPIDKEYSLCMIDETRPTDGDDGFAMLVDKTGKLRLPPTTYARYELKDPKTGKPWQFMISDTRYYSYAGRIGLKTGRLLEFYYFDKLGQSVWAFDVIRSPGGKVELKPAPDGTYDMMKGDEITIKNSLLDAPWNENDSTIRDYPFDAETP